MFHSRKDHSRERGQILVLFELVFIVILACAALVIDLGVLRNNRQILVNTFDAAAISGGSQLPVTGATAEAKLHTLVDQTIQSNYPGGLATSNYTIIYKCLIGANASGPFIARDIPVTCDPRISLGVPVNNPPTASDIAALTPKFTGAGLTRVSSCNPTVGDKCNVVQITGSANTQYALAPVVGVNNGSTGTVVSAACNGPCGAATSVPVDLVVIIDRTASMSDPDVAATRDAADAVLGVYNPAIQRVALGLLGPSSANSSCNGTGGPAVKVNTLIPGTLTAPAIAGSTTADVQSAANVAGGATTLVITKPTSTANGNFLVAGITVAGGSGTAVSAPAGWTLIQRTDNGANVSLLTYYHVAGSSEGANYTWTITTPVAGVRASGGILRYTGVNTSSPINVKSTNTGASSMTVTANSVTTTSAQTALVGFYSTATKTTFTAAAGLTERFDVQNTNALGPTEETATVSQAAAGASGNKAATAAAAGLWAAQLIALNPVPVDTYGATVPADLGKWIPIGFTGTDSDTPAPVYNEAYVSGSPATLNAGSHIVSAISCFDSPGGTGTNLATPIAMASYYLQNYGRPNVTWGILLETDGQPSYSSTGDSGNYTCAGADTAASNAKAIKNANNMAIQIFTVGFGLDGANNANCPDGSGAFSGKKARQLLASMATQPSVDGGCPGTSNTDGDHFFCQPKTSDLTAIFSQIATSLAGKGSHLVQLYPAPVVTHAAGPTSAVAISGQYFSGATSVTIGGANCAFSVGSDNSITAQAPARASGTVVDVIVSSPGGTSSIWPGDLYTYP